MDNKKQIKDSSLLVVGLVRNCSKHLIEDVNRLRLALGNPIRLQWLLIESDSNDNSIELLDSLTNKIENFKFMSLGVLREKMPLRTERIAYCRNHYIQEIQHNSDYMDVDYVIVSDFDGLNTHISKAAIESCWEKSEWDVCAANQNGPYYDISALRHDSWCPNDCWVQYNFLNQFRSNTEKNLNCAVHSRMITIPSKNDWIEVKSAFGGLAIYRKQVFEKAVYTGLNSDGSEICEHVPFHLSLIEKGYRIFINPKMINAAYTEHTAPLLFVNRLKRKCKSMITAHRLIEYLKLMLKSFLA